MYRKIDTSIWTDPRVRALGPPEKLLFVYLITNNHSHVSGIYYLPIPLICHELGLSEEQFGWGIDTLSKGYLALYDTPSEVVWVVNMLRKQGSGQKIIQSVASQLRTLHKCPLIGRYLKHYAELKIPYRYPIEGASQVGVKEQEQEQEQERDTQKRARARGVCLSGLVQDFNRLCPSMPRAEATTTRREQFGKQLLKHPDPEYWRRVFAKAEASDFLSGRNGKWTTCGIDWLLDEGNRQKVLEGNYDNKGPSVSAPVPPPSPHAPRDTAVLDELEALERDREENPEKYRMPEEDRPEFLRFLEGDGQQQEEAQEDQLAEPEGG